jgi:hypothetical protein
MMGNDKILTPSYGHSEIRREDGSGYAVPEQQYHYDTEYRGHEPEPVRNM